MNLNFKINSTINVTLLKIHLHEIYFQYFLGNNSQVRNIQIYIFLNKKFKVVNKFPNKKKRWGSEFKFSFKHCLFLTNKKKSLNKSHQRQQHTG